jgi:hypothetical protein
MGHRWPTYVLTVEIRPPRAWEGMAEPAPPILRLRAWLKLGLRIFGLVCVEARELPAKGNDG